MTLYKKIIICLFLVIICGCTPLQEHDTDKIETTSTQETGFKIYTVNRTRKMTLDTRITNINLYLGDEYHEMNKDNGVSYYNDDIQIFIDNDQKVQEIVILTNRYIVEGEIHVGEDISMLKDRYKYHDYTFNDVEFISYNKSKDIKMIYKLNNNVIYKIIMTKNIE